MARFLTRQLLSIASVCALSLFATSCDMLFHKDKPEDPSLTDFSGGCKAVDLGLPSGTKWASCNVGASNAEEYGDYYCWGEVTPITDKDYVDTWEYDMDDPDGGAPKYTIKDGLKYLSSEDDAATVNWGTKWRIPTFDEFSELCNNCTFEWTLTSNKVFGVKVTGKNGNSIFLPAACKVYRNTYGELVYDDSVGTDRMVTYPTNEVSRFIQSAFVAFEAKGTELAFQKDPKLHRFECERRSGFPVRAVAVK